MTGETTYDVHPPEPRWTHVALRVNDINATIEWYTTNTPMSLITRREDEMGYAAWLGHADNPASPFLLVVSQFFPGKDPFEGAPHTVLGPFAHLGSWLGRRRLPVVVARAVVALGRRARAPVPSISARNLDEDAKSDDEDDAFVVFVPPARRPRAPKTSSKMPMRAVVVSNASRCGAIRRATPTVGRARGRGRRRSCA